MSLAKTPSLHVIGLCQLCFPKNAEYPASVNPAVPENVSPALGSIVCALGRRPETVMTEHTITGIWRCGPRGLTGWRCAERRSCELLLGVAKLRTVPGALTAAVVKYPRGEWRPCPHQQRESGASRHCTPAPLHGLAELPSPHQQGANVESTLSQRPVHRDSDGQHGVFPATLPACTANLKTGSPHQSQYSLLPGSPHCVRAPQLTLL